MKPDLTRRALHLLHPITGPNGVIHHVVYQPEAEIALTRDPVVVHQEAEPAKSPVHLVGGNGAVGIKSHMRYRLVWHVALPVGAKTMAEATQAVTYRIPAEHGYFVEPIVKVGEGDTAQWMPAEKAAERERALGRETDRGQA